MLKKIAKRVAEIKERKHKGITEEIEQKVENADKREFNNPHIEREVTFSKTDELRERFSKQYESEIEELNLELTKLENKASEYCTRNIEKVAEQYSHINRIDDIVHDIKNNTHDKLNAVAYLLTQIADN